MRITQLQSIGVSAATEAWRLSRDVNVRTPFADIAKVDAPVNEMPCAVLYFEDFTILEREIFMSMRNHVAWARTSRVDDPLQFRTPDVFGLDVLNEKTGWSPNQMTKDTMRRHKEAGRSQDVWRGLLPLVALTSWTMRISLRDLVKLKDYFNWLATVAYEGKDRSPIGIRFTMIRDELERTIELYAPCDAFSVGKVEKILATDFAYTGERVVRTNYFVTVQMRVSLMLRAQIIRHRPISFVDNLFDLLRREDVSRLNQTMPVCIEMTAPWSFWKAILVKRSCWIAQYDLWAPVIELLGSDGTLLPCDAGAPCVCDEDNRLRLEGKDPSPPCPIWLRRNDQTFNHGALRRYAGIRPDFWQKEIDQ